MRPSIPCCARGGGGRQAGRLSGVLRTGRQCAGGCTPVVAALRYRRVGGQQGCRRPNRWGVVGSNGSVWYDGIWHGPKLTKAVAEVPSPPGVVASGYKGTARDPAHHHRTSALLTKGAFCAPSAHNRGGCAVPYLPYLGGAPSAQRGLKGRTRMKMGLYSTCLVKVMGHPPILRMPNPFFALVCPGSQVGCRF